MPKIITSQDIDLGAELGSGHFGKVYKGKVRPFGDVAVKVVEPMGKGSFDLWKDHLLAEADKLHAAEHSSVVRFFGCGYDDATQRVFIVTELCQGSIADEVGSNPLPLARAYSSMHQVLLGLECLHRKEMLHRDIKPANILVSQKGVSKLADFGLVTDQLIDGYASDEAYVQHMAPEVFIHGVTSKRTDVWSMGITVFRLLNGERWWQEWVSKHGLDDYSNVRSLVCGGGFAKKLPWMPHVPDAWRRFTRQALHDDTSKRFQDATEMLSKAAKLPTEPSWSCLYGGDTIEWRSCGGGTRDTVVSWTGRGTPRQELKKWTEPSAGVAGRKRTAASHAEQSTKHAARQAEVLLGTRKT